MATNKTPKTPMTEIEKLRKAWQERITRILKLVFPEAELGVQHDETDFKGTLQIDKERALHFTRHLYTNRLIIEGSWPRWGRSTRGQPRPERDKMAWSLTCDDEQLAYFIQEKWMPFYDAEFEILREQRDAELAAIKAINEQADALAQAAGVKRSRESSDGIVNVDPVHVQVARDGKVNVAFDDIDFETAKRILSALTPPSK